MHQIVVNLKTGYKQKLYYSICGTSGSKHNRLESHHVRHIRKGKVSRFTQLMKNLNRKTVPVCNTRHKKIHKGTYDRYALSSLFDTDIISA